MKMGKIKNQKENEKNRSEQVDFFKRTFIYYDRFLSIKRTGEIRKKMTEMDADFYEHDSDVTPIRYFSFVIFSLTFFNEFIFKLLSFL